MIPKKIHYCWFGGNPLPELAKKCIESWKRFCPDYDIIEWNETNFDVNFNDYVKEAYQAKKWAFVSDVARFKILYDNGGLYFDTDVEIIRTIDDVLKKGAFMGVETDEKGTVAPGLGLAVEKGNVFYKEMLDFYQTQKFTNEDGSLNLTTIVEYTTEKLKLHGYKKSNEIQCVDGIYIYPQRYFSPKDVVTKKIKITEDTLTIHHFSGTWLPPSDREYMRLTEKYNKFMPNFLARKTARVIAEWKCNGFLKGTKILFSKAKKKK